MLKKILTIKNLWVKLNSNLHLNLYLIQNNHLIENIRQFMKINPYLIQNLQNLLAVTLQVIMIVKKGYNIIDQLHNLISLPKILSNSNKYKLEKHKLKINYHLSKKNIHNLRNMFKINWNSSKSLLHQCKLKWLTNFNNSSLNLTKINH